MLLHIFLKFLKNCFVQFDCICNRSFSLHPCVPCFGLMLPYPLISHLQSNSIQSFAQVKKMAAGEMYFAALLLSLL